MSDPEKELEKSWSIGRLRPWLSLLAERELPDVLRGRVIELRHFEGKSHQEIAELMQRSPAAIRMLWVRALRNLK